MADQATYEPCGGYRLPPDVGLTGDLLARLVADYRQAHVPRLARLRRSYEGDHDILHQPAKAEYKPDNRIVANYSKQIVDSMVGYFLGHPVKLVGDDDATIAWLNGWRARNDADDLDAELSRLADIYGQAFEVMWRDEAAEPRSTFVGPMNLFVVRDDSVEGRMLYAVRFWLDDNRFDGRTDTMRGTLYDQACETPFTLDGGTARLGEPVPHGFPGVPVVEYVDNEERQGLFEGVLSLIDAHDKALSEKANDVEYYADAYLKILGAHVEDKDLDSLRDSRIINLEGRDAASVQVEFLSKPDADGTQENLINRLERLIFTLSMVSDLSSDTFDTSSGIAIKYRLQAMSDLALVKERKFRRGLNRRHMLLCGYAGNSLPADAWTGVGVRMERNIPSNLLEESQIAGNLAGVTSEETRLSVLSCVPDVKAERRRMADEQEERVAQVVPSRAATGAADDAAVE